MEFHRVVAICIIIALALVIDSGIKLFRYRRRNEIRDRFRDFHVLRRPSDFPLVEARLTYKCWIASMSTLGLVLLFLATAPPGEGPLDSLSSGPPPPNGSTGSAD